ncbi:PIN domain-containing protein [Geobacillus sp. C56-T2]|uniref:PIN domain-containing protein n=1 Tax=Geobacillus sp. C56-T2 TaxID=600773 RepID=UPI0011A9A8B1|nr:type II toxin-antitoxin system VapC family toxin [Geobacillus sp. C56-T2]NNV06136.1 PIN domain-containing protein [Geobacillus sp. MMMUD3]
MYILDTNIIIRFLTNDDQEQSSIAYRLFEKAVNGELLFLLHPLVVAECCWVLESKRYGYAKEEIASKLKQMIEASCVKTIDQEVVEKALDDYARCGVDFADAYLSALTRHTSSIQGIITWNEKDFRRLGGECYLPESIIGMAQS